jgi:hypothetical protein
MQRLVAPMADQLLTASLYFEVRGAEGAGRLRRGGGEHRTVCDTIFTDQYEKRNCNENGPQMAGRESESESDRCPELCSQFSSGRCLFRSLSSCSELNYDETVWSDGYLFCFVVIFFILWRTFLVRHSRLKPAGVYSTVTDFARLRGLSTSVPRASAV